MRKYLATLHTRSDRHKKHFALLVSGGFTLFIFAIWSAVNFGENGVFAQKNADKEDMNEISPIESVKDSLATPLEGIKDTFEGLRGGLMNGYGR